MERLRSVVTIYPAYQPRPGFRSFRLLVETLLAQDVDVHVVSAGELRLDPHDRLHIHQIDFGRLKRSWYFSLVFAFCAPFRLWQILRQNKADAMVCTEPSLSCILVPVGFVSRKPLVTVLEAPPWLARRARTRSRLRRGFGTIRDYLGLVSSDKILAATDALAEEIRRRVPLAAQKVESLQRKVIFPLEIRRDEHGELLVDSWRDWLNGQQNRRRKLADDFQLPDKWLYVAAPSELVGRRNLEILLRALSTLESERLVLMFCGHNPERNYLEALAVGLGVYEQLLFADSLSAGEIFGACDLFVLPATRAGNSQLLAEALGSGLPVLVSDTEENRELVAKESWRFETNNVQALAQKLEWLTTSKSQLDAERRSAREAAPRLGSDWGLRLRNSLLS